MQNDPTSEAPPRQLQHSAERPEWAVAVRQRRKALGLTQRQVADLAGIAERTVIAVEQGRPSVTLAHLLDVLRVLGLHLRVARGRGGTIAADVDD